MTTYPNDAIVSTGGTMTQRKPDRGLSYTNSFGVSEYQSQIPGYTARRLRSRRPVRTYTLTYTNIYKSQLDAIMNFYSARSGSFESFDFDLSHINQEGTIRVVFADTPSITQVFSTDNNDTDIYSINFNLKETFV